MTSVLGETAAVLARSGARPAAWWKPGAPTLVWLGGLVLALALDRLAYTHLTIADAEARQAMESKDWYRLLRIMGSMWTWGAVAAALMLIDRGRIRGGAVIRGWWTRRGVVLGVSALLSGAAAEGVKVLVGRMRPGTADGWYTFMPIAERLRWDWSQLGMPSSHAAVAFGAAVALSLKYRAAAPVFLLGAAGCGLTRVMTGQHYLSDVYVAAWIAYAVALAVWRVDAWNNGGVALGEPGTGVGGEAWIGRVGTPARPAGSDAGVGGGGGKDA